MTGAKAERGTSSTVRSSPSQLAHPFYVVPVKAVLAMDGLRPHEEVREQLIEWQEGMEVVFFSHTWLNYDHPDHKGQKFALLKSLLERACAGKLDMSTHVQTWIGHAEQCQDPEAAHSVACGCAPRARECREDATRCRRRRAPAR